MILPKQMSVIAVIRMEVAIPQLTSRMGGVIRALSWSVPAAMNFHHPQGHILHIIMVLMILLHMETCGSLRTLPTARYLQST